MARSVKSSPPPDLAVRDAATRFMTSIWQLQRELGHELDPLLRERAGTDPRAYFLLRTIQDGAQYPKVLSECLGIPPNLLSRFLSDLNAQGLIARQLDEQDSRRVRLSLTPVGTRALGQAEEVIHDCIGARLSRLDVPQLAALLDALHTLTSPDLPPCATQGTRP